MMLGGVIGFVLGVIVVLAISWIASQMESKPPPPPRCTAVLRSGERCVYDDGDHPYHRAKIYVPQHTVPEYQQDYAWEDETRGVHSVGFFPKGRL
jgi:hypothetical protein